MTNYLFLGMYP